MTGQQYIMIKGSLQLDKGKYYVVRAWVPDPKTGIKKLRTKATGITVKGSKRQAERIMREILAQWEQEANKTVYEDDPLFSEYVQKFLDQKAHDVRENTLFSYTGYAKTHVLPALGDMKIREIKRQHIQGFYNTLLSKGLTPKSIRKIAVVVSGAFHVAIQEDVIHTNVAKDSDIVLPTSRKFRGKAYTQDQATKLLEILEIEGGAIRCAGTLAIYYGLRRSEVCGLRWCDIDFDKNEIHIENTVTQNGGKVFRDQETKTEKSRRILTLVPDTIPYLKELKQEQIRKGFTLDKVCRHPNGKEVLPAYITEKNRRMLKKYDMEHIRFHDYRATCASLLAPHLTPKQLQEFMGHEQISTTMEIYVKAYDEDRKIVAATMGSIFGKAEVHEEKCSDYIK